MTKHQDDPTMHLSSMNLLLSPISLLAICLLLSCQSSQGQQHAAEIDREVGGPFENRDLIYVGMPDALTPIDTSPAWNLGTDKLLITGTIFKRDGKTPAADVILYYYHTNLEGLYPKQPNLDRRARPHGYIRGWVKTGSDGKYAIYTTRPGAYPSWTQPAHIHPAIKEPGMTPYWIDAFVFDDDKLLTTTYRKAQGHRGGSGVMRLLQDENQMVAEHDIILGLNIPNHPHAK